MNLELHNVDEHRHIVCARCGQPTAVTATFTIVAATNLRTLHHFDITVCETCDGEEDR